jgi:hypothetical protein
MIRITATSEEWEDLVIPGTSGDMNAPELSDPILTWFILPTTAFKAAHRKFIDTSSNMP